MCWPETRLALENMNAAARILRERA